MNRLGENSSTVDRFEQEKIALTPETGFDLIGIDYFTETGGQLYLVKHFEAYQDALDYKKQKRNPDEFFILYKGTGGEFLCR